MVIKENETSIGAPIVVVEPAVLVVVSGAVRSPRAVAPTIATRSRATMARYPYTMPDRTLGRTGVTTRTMSPGSGEKRKNGRERKNPGEAESTARVGTSRNHSTHRTGTRPSHHLSKIVKQNFIQITKPIFLQVKPMPGVRRKRVKVGTTKVTVGERKNRLIKHINPSLAGVRP